MKNFLIKSFFSTLLASSLILAAQASGDFDLLGKTNTSPSASVSTALSSNNLPPQESKTPASQAVHYGLKVNYFLFPTSAKEQPLTVFTGLGLEAKFPAYGLTLSGGIEGMFRQHSLDLCFPGTCLFANVSKTFYQDASYTLAADYNFFYHRASYQIKVKDSKGLLYSKADSGHFSHALGLKVRLTSLPQVAFSLGFMHDDYYLPTSGFRTEFNHKVANTVYLGLDFAFLNFN